MPEEKQSPARPEVKVKAYFRRMGGGSLAISLAIHGGLLALALFWILRVTPPPPVKAVDFRQSAPGGGAESPSRVNQREKRAMRMRESAARVSAAGVSTDLALPEISSFSPLSSLGGMGALSRTGGMGGGAGKAEGSGAGQRGGMGHGMDQTLPGAASAFGIMDAGADALEGTFYDFKQTKGRKPTGISNGEMVEEIRKFVNGGWREKSALNNYYSAPHRLFQKRIQIPNMPAAAAPAAFNCEKEVEPGRWMIIYRGTVTPPRTGSYRFVGGADDILAVRFNGRNVFDHGYYSATTGLHIRQVREILAGGNGDGDKRLKNHAMKPPLSFLKYGTTRTLNLGIGGMARGIEFEAKAGTSYDIEILIAEVPGGSFGASLLIEKIGENYRRTAEGLPILPLFNVGMSGGRDIEGEVPPHDAAAPPWRVTGVPRPRLSGAAW